MGTSTTHSIPKTDPTFEAHSRCFIKKDLENRSPLSSTIAHTVKSGKAQHTTGNKYQREFLKQSSHGADGGAQAVRQQKIKLEEKNWAS